jgi:hypothetical protein
MKKLTLCICFLMMALSWTKGQDVSSTPSGGSVVESDRKFLSDLEQANKPKPPFRTAKTLNASPVNVPSAAKEAEPKPTTTVKKATDILPESPSSPSKVAGPASSKSLNRETLSNGTESTTKQPKQRVREKVTVAVGIRRSNRENLAELPEIAANDGMLGEAPSKPVPVKSVKPNGGVLSKVPQAPMNPQPVTITKTTVTTTTGYDVDNRDHGFLHSIFHRDKADLRPGE